MDAQKLHDRLKVDQKVSDTLGAMSDLELAAFLQTAKPMHVGAGGTSVLLKIGNTRIFVKQIALTDLEALPENWMSTANLFDLPMPYHYGVGSSGFGAWRELKTHIATSEWVREGACPNFPLLYHWRVLPRTEPPQIAYWGDMNKYMKFWEGNEAIRKRVQAIEQATQKIVLFLEYVPYNLHEWLGGRTPKGGKVASAAITFVDNHVNELNAFTRSRGMIHFDEHFGNILTDNDDLYMTDFGLALLESFEMTPEERAFFEAHRAYDACSACANIPHSTMTILFGNDRWNLRFQEYLAGQKGKLPQPVDQVLRRCAPVALRMDDFFRQLKNHTKQEPYPREELESQLDQMWT